MPLSFICGYVLSICTVQAEIAVLWTLFIGTATIIVALALAYYLVRKARG
jgi:hypothetical protein